MLARNSRFAATLSMSISICIKLPATVISDTGYASSPFSIQRPAAPEE